MATKKLMRLIAIASFVLSIVLFLAMSIHFDSDPVIFEMLENDDVISTLHRLSIYFIPGMCMIGGMFALVFSTKKILITMAIAQIVTAYLLNIYVGKSVFMFAMFIVYMAVSRLYLAGALFYKTEIKKSR